LHDAKLGKVGALDLQEKNNLLGCIFYPSDKIHYEINSYFG